MHCGGDRSDWSLRSGVPVLLAKDRRLNRQNACSYLPHAMTRRFRCAVRGFSTVTRRMASRVLFAQPQVSGSLGVSQAARHRKPLVSQGFSISLGGEWCTYGAVCERSARWRVSKHQLCVFLQCGAVPALGSHA